MNICCYRALRPGFAATINYEPLTTSLMPLHKCQCIIRMFFALHHGCIGERYFAFLIYHKSLTAGHKHFILHPEFMINYVIRVA